MITFLLIYVDKSQLAYHLWSKHSKYADFSRHKNWTGRSRCLGLKLLMKLSQPNVYVKHTNKAVFLNLFIVFLSATSLGTETVLRTQRKLAVEKMPQLLYPLRHTSYSEKFPISSVRTSQSSATYLPCLQIHRRQTMR